MAIRKIARMGHPVLRAPVRTLSPEDIRSPEFEMLLRDMIETMNDAGGIGIAAPQIYESVAVAIVDYQGNYRGQNPDAQNNPDSNKAGMPFTVVINPRITVLDPTEQSFWEGCLSVPELSGLVHRPKKIQVDYLDQNAKPHTVIAEGFLATVFQHEIDHLMGNLFVDRVRPELGKTTLAFTEEYQRFLIPENSDENETDVD
jgi:peptide deformylase